MRHDDNWLDAFRPDECRTPELSRHDAAVARILERTGAPATALVSRPRRWMHLAGALAASVLLAGAGVWLATPPTSPAPVAAAVPFVAPKPRAAPHAPEDVAAPPAVAAVARTASRAVAPPPPAPPPPVTVPPPASGFGAGLVVHAGAVVLPVGADVRLVAGALTFVREGGLDPGVARVQLDELPLVLEPLGTRFTVVVGAGAAALSVAHGRVAVRTRDDVSVALVAEDESVLVLAGSDGGQQVVSLRGLDLDAVHRAVVPGGRTSPADAVALVARLRLLGADPTSRDALLDPGGL